MLSLGQNLCLNPQIMDLLLVMPKPGETITEALIVNWLKSEGNSVEEKEPIFEMETEKAVFEYESPLKGTLQKILVKGGQKVAVGTPIAAFSVEEAEGKRYITMGVAIPASGETA